VPDVSSIPKASLTLADRWILSRMQATIREATASLEQFRLDEAAKRCFDFVWKDLADWYVELVKPRQAGGDTTAAAVIVYCFDTTLRLLHPVVPFITEELWKKLPGQKEDDLLPVAQWPEDRAAFADAEAERSFARVQDTITAIRNIRAEYRVPPKQRLTTTVLARSGETSHALTAERETVMRLATLEALDVNGGKPAAGAHAVLADGSEVVVQLAGAIDVKQECQRLGEELTRLDRQLQSLAAKLANDNFVSRAPAEVVAKERDKERTWREQRDVLAGKLSALGCS
jgi:valyl-tRNA synthetase